MPHDHDSPAAELTGAADVSDTAPSASHAGCYLLLLCCALLCVMGWLFVGWLFHEQQDPYRLVQGIQQPGRDGWQNAYALAQLLSDPDAQQLKQDARLCQALADQLQQQNERASQPGADRGPEDFEQAQLRVYLCRALGQFQLPAALPPLLECAAIDTAVLAENSPERQVRCAALESIAVLAAGLDPPGVCRQEPVIAVLRDACRDTGQTDTDIPSAATFALGVIGGDQATSLLGELAADARLDVRFNAATGLARQGHPLAVAGVLEMLDPAHPDIGAAERTESAQLRKREMVLRSGIQACAPLLRQGPSSARQPLIEALERLRDCDACSARVRMDAKEMLLHAQPVQSRRL